MTTAYDPRADWDREDAVNADVARLAADYARNVERYHASVRLQNEAHQRRLADALNAFDAEQAALIARLQRLVVATDRG